MIPFVKNEKIPENIAIWVHWIFNCLQAIVEYISTEASYWGCLKYLAYSQHLTETASNEVYLILSDFAYNQYVTRIHPFLHISALILRGLNAQHFASLDCFIENKKE